MTNIDSILGFPGGSDGKNVCLQCGRPRFHPWVGKIPCRRNRTAATEARVLTTRGATARRSSWTAAGAWPPRATTGDGPPQQHRPSTAENLKIKIRRNKNIDIKRRRITNKGLPWWSSAGAWVQYLLRELDRSQAPQLSLHAASKDPMYHRETRCSHTNSVNEFFKENNNSI